MELLINIATVLTKVTNNVPKQGAINSDIEQQQRLVSFETILETLLQSKQHLKALTTPKSHLSKIHHEPPLPPLRVCLPVTQLSNTSLHPFGPTLPVVLRLLSLIVEEDARLYTDSSVPRMQNPLMKTLTLLCIYSSLIN